MDGSIQKYMAFVKTVECGSFTKAAEQLSYSQSGISRMINDLEKEWKVVLLERSKSGVKLTSRRQADRRRHQNPAARQGGLYGV